MSDIEYRERMDIMRKYPSTGDMASDLDRAHDIDILMKQLEEERRSMMFHVKTRWTGQDKKIVLSRSHDKTCYDVKPEIHACSFEVKDMAD